MANIFAELYTTQVKKSVMKLISELNQPSTPSSIKTLAQDLSTEVVKGAVTQDMINSFHTKVIEAIESEPLVTNNMKKLITGIISGMVRMSQDPFALPLVVGLKASKPKGSTNKNTSDTSDTVNADTDEPKEINNFKEPKPAVPAHKKK